MIALLIVAGMGVLPNAYAAAATAPVVGTENTFALLSGATFTVAGTGTTITGDAGSSPTGTCTGFPSPCSGTILGNTVTGTIYLDTGTGVAATAQSYFAAAYTAATAQLPGTVVGTAELNTFAGGCGSGCFTPGVYSSGSTLDLATGTTMTLQCASSSSVFIFIAGTSLTANVGSTVTVTGGCGSNVFWVVGASATLNGPTFVGNVLADTASITVGTSVTVTGRLWSHIGTITLAGADTITTGPANATGCNSKSNNDGNNQCCNSRSNNGAIVVANNGGNNGGNNQCCNSQSNNGAIVAANNGGNNQCGTTFSCPAAPAAHADTVTLSTPPRGSTLILNIQHGVQNDEDSAVGGGYWALDYYTVHLQVWQTGTNSFYAMKTYNGIFQTPQGADSPQTPSSMEQQSAYGSFQGGYVATFTATSFNPLNYPTKGDIGTFNYGGTTADVLKGTSGTGDTSPFSFLSAYFPGSASFTQPTWGWVYSLDQQFQSSTSVNTWCNFSTGNFGNIIATASTQTVPESSGGQ